MENKNQRRAEEMRGHIEACKQSGLSVVAYCKQHGIVKSVYYKWVKKWSSENTVAGFTQVDVASTSTTIEITYPNGVRLSYSGALDTSTLKLLVCCI
jgi:transposase-like protein